MWPNHELLDLLAIELPIIQAPMAGSNDAKLAIAVSQAGGLGSLPCAMLSADKIELETAQFRSATDKPFNINFFCHKEPKINPQEIERWRACLAPYYQEFGLEFSADETKAIRRPFDKIACELVEYIKPPVVSFHFGLPATELFQRVKNTGCKVLSSATTVAEARWLENIGVDAIIAQGMEAGGHRGMFLSDDLTSQSGTMALVPQIASAVSVPVVAAGGIADGRGIAAAFALGAMGVQIGSAYLLCPEAKTSDLHRAALKHARDDNTALTNLFSGRPARGIVNRLMKELGPINNNAPAFPLASVDLTPLRTKAEAQSIDDFTPLWAGQAVSLAHEIPADQLTRDLSTEAQNVLKNKTD